MFQLPISKHLTVKRFQKKKEKKKNIWFSSLRGNSDECKMVAQLSRPLQRCPYKFLTRIIDL